MRIAYDRGLHEVGDGIYCYLQPDGTWGWSNAGLIAADGTSLLVDTLFDLELTRAMLDAMRPITEKSPIDAAMNTHGNGDHCFGNELLPDGAEIYATAAAAAEMQAAPPQLVNALKHADALGPDFSAYINRIFGPFRFEGIELRPPSATFDGRLEVTIGDRAVHFIEVGPAHTDGDAIVHVPDAGVVFTGDILFVEGTPIVWAGPFANWLDACDRLLALDAPTLVPGHGPVTDASGVRDVKRYLTYVREEARARFDAGMDAQHAADDIDLSDFAGWGDAERIAANVATAYREFDPSLPEPQRPELFVRMARWASRHRPREDRRMAVDHRPVHAGFDPLSDEFLADPYAVMASLPLAETPVFFAPALDGYVVTRHEDIDAVFHDPATYSAAAAQMPLVPLVPEAAEILLAGGHKPQPSMVSLDPPAHTRLRRPSSRAFTPRRVAEMEPRVRATLADLLDAVDATRPFDIVRALTFPLPATIIFSFMGVPEEDYAQLKEWCGHRASLAWGRPSPAEQVEHATSMAAYRAYLRELVAAKATDRADDFASALLAIHDEDPEALTQEEIASILFSLSFAGHETTNYLIGNMIRRLLEAPERWDAVVADPALIPGVVEETLRHDTSVPFWRRRTKRAVTLGGVEIPEGATLFLWLAAAGHDPAVFDEPDRFDPTRPNAKRHLAFGKGIHFCIGSALGKLEAQLALEELTRRFPRLRLVEDQPALRFHPNISFRGPLEMWVRAD